MIVLSFPISTEMTMLRIVILGAMISLAGAAYAQTLTSEQRAACGADYEKFCKGTMPGGGRIVACMTKVSDKLTPECRKTLIDAQKK
jgi:hypothetical protein